jgi:hypothetical protein
VLLMPLYLHCHLLTRRDSIMVENPPHSHKQNPRRGFIINLDLNCLLSGRSGTLVVNHIHRSQGIPEEYYTAFLCNNTFVGNLIYQIPYRLLFKTLKPC